MYKLDRAYVVPSTVAMYYLEHAAYRQCSHGWLASRCNRVRQWWIWLAAGCLLQQQFATMQVVEQPHQGMTDVSAVLDDW